jgi:repressor LexA
VIEFNLNDRVCVKITEDGMAALKSQHEELKSLIPMIGDFNPPKTDDEGWSRWQLWTLMERFGGLIGPTMPTPFETTIRLDVEEI